MTPVESYFSNECKSSSKLVAYPVKDKNKNKLAAGYLEKENFPVSFLFFLTPKLYIQSRL